MMEDEVIAVSAKVEDTVLARLKVIVDTYNLLARKFTEKQIESINVELYLKDVSFLIGLLHVSGDKLKEYEQREKEAGKQ